MKFANQGVGVGVGVALFTRAWIEMWTMILRYIPLRVALFTRAWIEMPS